jgi:hypothetical protein
VGFFSVLSSMGWLFSFGFLTRLVFLLILNTSGNRRREKPKTMPHQRRFTHAKKSRGSKPLSLLKIN